MSSDDLADFWVHRVAVATATGTNSSARTIRANPVAIEGFLTRRRRLVRSADGDQVVSESSFSTDVAHAALFTPDTEVTLIARLDDAGWTDLTGQPTSTVLTIAVSDSGDLDLPDRVKVYLT